MARHYKIEMAGLYRKYPEHLPGPTFDLLYALEAKKETSAAWKY